MPNKAADLPTTTIAKFEKALRDRSAFSCGFAPMDNFLKSSLSDQIQDGMVTAWMATAKGQNTVLGFYTLGAMAVRAEFGPKKGHHLASCAQTWHFRYEQGELTAFGAFPSNELFSFCPSDFGL